MTFINEYVSEEDIEKYRLEEAKLSYRPEYSEEGLPSSYKYNWTIDRERNIYLMLARIGKEEFSNRFTWVLNINGQEFKVETDLNSARSMNINEKPFRVIWDWVEESSVDKALSKKVYLPTDETHRNILKAALAVYGRRGAIKQIEGTIVTFNF